MKVNELVEQVRVLLHEKDFAYDKYTFWEKIGLVHTEVSELAQEVKRNGFVNQTEIENEIADIIIRTINFALMFDVDLEKAIQNKMNENFARPKRYNTVDEE